MHEGSVRLEQDRAFALINQGERQSSNLGFRMLHAEQQRNTYEEILPIYVGGILLIQYIVISADIHWCADTSVEL